METVFRLKASELNDNFLKTIKKLFKKSAEFEIIIHPISSKNSHITETKAEMRTRIEKAIDDIENNRNLVRFTGEEFEAYCNKLLSE